MKSTFTLLFITVFISTTSAQDWKLIGGYNLAIPQGHMNDNINPAHSMQAGALYKLKGPLKRLSVGFDAGIGIYAMKRIDQTFTFDNNFTSIVPVNYNSNILNANINARYNLAGDEKLFIPYITIKGGVYNFFSTIYVEDPQDGGCHALQRDNIIKDATLAWTGGAGLQINTSVFSKRKFRRNVMIDISVNSVRGGRIDYINTTDLVDAQTLNNPGSKPLQVRFVNASTQNIHEHTVAQVHNSPLRMIEIRLGIVVNIER